MKTKRIEYSYPTSANAERFGYRNGCYCVELQDGIKPPKAIAGFATIEAAEVFAASLHEQWNSLTKRAPGVHPRYLVAEQAASVEYRKSEFAQDFETANANS